MSVHCRKGPKIKVLGKIWKKHRNSKRLEDSGSQKERWRSATGWPHPPRRGPGQVAPGVGVATPWHYSDSPSGSRGLLAFYNFCDFSRFFQALSFLDLFSENNDFCGLIQFKFGSTFCVALIYHKETLV